MVPLFLRKNYARVAFLFLLAAIALSVALSNRLIRSALADDSSIAPKPLTAESSAAKNIADRYGRLPLRFEPNEGQTDSRVKFLSRGPGYDLFLTTTDAVLVLRAPQPRRGKFVPMTAAEPIAAQKKEASVLRLKMVGADSKARVEGLEQLPGQVNYLIGDDPNKWLTSIPTYLKVKYADIYPGVDIVYYGNRTELEYDFVIAAGANPNAIKFELEGADQIKLDAFGDLRLIVSQQEVRLRKPFIYQTTDSGERQEVQGKYDLRGKQIGFKLKSYDSRRPLIIDPVLSYATLIGSGGNEYAYGIAVDASGAAYITGNTDSSLFPRTPGTIQAGQSGGAFVTKLDPTGSNLVYSTYIGGDLGAIGAAIAVDPAGNAIITGHTLSSDFPLVNPVKTKAGFFKSVDASANWSNVHTGMSFDVSAVAVAPSAPSTIYAGTFQGPFVSTDAGATWQKPANAGLTGFLAPASMAVDPTNAQVVYAGLINGGLFKTTNGGTSWSLLTLPSSGFVVFSIVFDPVTPSTVYVGTGNGVFKSIDSGGNWTSLNNFNVGTVNVRALAIDPTNTSIIYAGTFASGFFKTTDGGASWFPMNNGMAGSFANYVNAIAIDPTNPATLYAGQGYAGTGGLIHKSTNGATSWTPINDGVPNFEVSSLVIDRLNPSTLYAGTMGGGVIKTTNGGANWNQANAGLWRSSVLELACDPVNPSILYAATSGGSTELDAFVSKLNPTGTALLFSSYLGGSLSDQGYGIALEGTGNVVVAGQTSSKNFPAVNAFKSVPAPADNCTDGFVIKLNLSGPPAIVYSTYLGGDACDTAYAVATDASGSAYVTGTTSSNNFPVANAFQSVRGEQSFGGDAFVTKFDNAGALSYSTFLGGNGADTGHSIATDSTGNAYITGSTQSSNFPRLNPLQSTYGGIFVTKLNNLGSGLVYSTYFGGPNFDTGRGIAVDSAGNAYVTGFTRSAEFQVVSGALQTRSPLFKSVNGGDDWSNDNYGLLAQLTCLAIDPVSTSTVYAGTSAGVYKSTNGGRNWTAINNGLGALRIVEIVIDPITPTTLYAGSYDISETTANGVYKSTDGGTIWTRMSNGIVNPSIQTLVIDPLTPTTLYAGTSGNLYKTTDGAANWVAHGGLTVSSILSLAIDPATPATLYAAVAFSNGGIFKSIDGGGSWFRVGFNETGPYALCVAVNPVNPAKVYATLSSGLFKSADSGATWTLVTGQFSNSRIVFDPLNASTVYVVNSSQGIFKSTNDGQTWTALNNGFKTNAAIDLAVDPVNPATLYAALAGTNDDDAFVSKFNSSGSALIYSTLVGGTPAPGNSSNLNDEGFAIALDPAGNAYIAGLSNSPNFPVTPNAYQPFNRGFSDAFISKLSMSYRISGQVLDGSSVPVSGAEVTLHDGVSLSSIITGSDGSYEFSHLREGGSFTVSASKPHFTMTPASQTFNNLTSDQVLNFTATASNANFYTISGHVTDGGAGLDNVTVTLSGSQSGLRTTGSDGGYSFTVVEGGNYTVTPSLLGFSFAPPSQTFNSLSANRVADFVATRQNFVVTNANNHGTGSLRQAILDANDTAGLDTIVFNIPGAGEQTINVLTAFPTITDPVVIDATTQPGYAGSPLIELNGTAVGSNAAGFAITAGGSTIRGFAINRFNAGIIFSVNGSNVIQGNYIGLDPTGIIRRGNTNGILMGTTSNNLIGGTTPAARNVISANGFDGISMGGSSNQISGNFIGTNAAGTANLGNGINGIDLFNVGGSPATNNIIGGTGAGAGNLISGNQRGISMNSSGAFVWGNLIGTDVTGTIAIGNGTGIQANAPNTVIGGTVPGARNVISGSTGDGLTIGGAGSRLEGNFIGTDITGTVALGNSNNGVVAGNGVLIGGTTPEARNIISANGGFGNVSLGSNSSGTQATVQGNYIGTDVTGTVALGDSLSGISISGSSNLIGGLVPGAQNLIAGNRIGIQIGGSIAPGPINNTIQGNFIGLNALGSPLPNSQGGIRVNDSSNNVIGGTASGAGNRICFSGGPGVSISSGTGNSVVGNSIFSNVGLGVDLGTLGVTANDALDADPGANNLQNFPSLTSVSSNGGSTTIQGTLHSAANTAYRIDFYSNAACNASGNGEGARHFDVTNVTTDANGNASINFISAQALAAGRVITATATDPAGNTSEFSTCDSANATGAVQFSAATLNVLEDIGNFTVNVLRTGGSKGTISVNYATANLTATAGSDYTAASGTLVFADGETSKSFIIPIADDGITEPDETLRITLSGVPELELLGSRAVATVNIQGNNTQLILSGNSIDVNEGNSGASNAVVTFSLSAATGRTVTANFNTQNNTAISPSDYTATSGNLTFAPGVTTQTVSIPIIGDTLNENNEIFFVVLSNATNAIGGIPGQVRILNDDPLPSISISDVTVTEGNSGTVNAVFNVALSNASGRGLSVGYATANNTATAGSDYTAISGRVNFIAGETLKTITVQVTGDTSDEPDETFFVNLSGPINATIGDSQATGTIQNDDGPVGLISFSQASYSVGESDHLITITVNRVNDLSSAATVDYATSDGGGVAAVPCSTINGAASSRCDFTTSLGKLRFAAGESSKTFIVLISQDNFVEGPETLTLTLSNSTGAVLATPSTATLTILDDVTEPPGNAIDTAEVFVRQHYHDFLNREPDAPGLAFWSNQITECEQPGATCNADVRRINVSAAFFLSIEFQETGYLVERLYKSAYGDALGTSNFGPTHQLPVPVIRFEEFLPDTQQIGLGVVVGEGDWQAKLEANKIAFAQDFVARSRFTTAFPTTLTPTQFVDALFLNAGVTPAAAERDSVIAEFGGAGTSADVPARARALRRVAENPTLAEQEKNKAFVLMQYYGYLRRNPNQLPDSDYSGYDFWLTKLNQFNGNFVEAEMVKAFITSGEYRGRFGP